MRVGCHIQVVYGEGDPRRYFGAEHELVPEPLQVHAQYFRQPHHARHFNAVAEFVAAGATGREILYYKSSRFYCSVEYDSKTSHKTNNNKINLIFEAKTKRAQPFGSYDTTIR